MNLNNAIQNQALVTWDGAVSTPRPINKHVYFAWTFEVKVTLGADAIFNVLAFDPDPANPCAPLAPGRAVNVVPICNLPYAPPAPTPAVITIPSGTPAGTIITATLPCRPAAFVGLQHVSGGANVVANLVLSKPTVLHNHFDALGNQF